MSQGRESGDGQYAIVTRATDLKIYLVSPDSRADSPRPARGKRVLQSVCPPAARARSPMPGTARKPARRSSPSGTRSGLQPPRFSAGFSARACSDGDKAPRYEYTKNPKVVWRLGWF